MAEARRARYRSLLSSSGPGQGFWDLVILTACSHSQANVYRRQVASLHQAGRLPLDLRRYAVLADPPGPRAGSGGATLAALGWVCSRKGAKFLNRAATGPGFLKEARILILHGGGYSERLPACSALGKVFAVLPCDVAGKGFPSTALEVALENLVDLPPILGPGVFIASSDVVLEFGAVPSPVPNVHEGILALAHPTRDLKMASGHGVFVTDGGGGGVGGSCRRCLQKPTADEMRAAGAVSAGGVVLTDSAFHLGGGAAAALLALWSSSSRQGASLRGVEVDCYGDFMQPMGSDPDMGYLGKGGHVASLLGSGSEALRKVEAAREAVAEVMKGRPLHVLALDPSTFFHVGTLPEVLSHFCGAGASEGAGFLPAIAGAQSVGTCGPPPSGADVCLLGSLLDPTSVVSGPCVVAHSRVGAGCVVGPGSLLFDVDLPAGSHVPPGTFLHTLAVAGGFVTIPLSASQDDVKKTAGSGGTLCGVGLMDAAVRLGLDPSEVWPEGVARTATAARVLPVVSSASASAVAALELMARARLPLRAGARPGGAAGSAGRRVSIHQSVRGLADHGKQLRRQSTLHRSIADATVRALLDGGQPATEWASRAPHLSALSGPWWDGLDGAARRAVEYIWAHGPVGATPRALLQQRACEGLDLLRPGHEYEGGAALEVAGRELLRDAIVGPVVEGGRSEEEAGGGSSNWLLGPPPPPETTPPPVGIKVTAEYPARINLAGGWSDTPPYCLEQGGLVLHAAITVGGRRPVRAAVEVVDLSALPAAPAGGKRGNNKKARGAALVEVVAGDSGESEAVADLAGLLDHADPADPLALHKAVLALVLVPGELPRGARALDPPPRTGALGWLSRRKPWQWGALAGVLVGGGAAEALVGGYAAHAAAEYRATGAAPPPWRLMRKGKAACPLAAALEARLGRGKGIRLTTAVDLPKGSGLGVSSILALACMHAAHDALSGRPLAPPPQWAGAARAEGGVGAAPRAVPEEVLFNGVLAVEQLLTTGGGWQDQVGGARAGVNLSASSPTDALPRYSITPMPLGGPHAEALSRHICLVFTGEQRLAKHVAATVVDEWVGRDPRVGPLLEGCKGIASEMAAALRDLARVPLSSLGDDASVDPVLAQMGALLNQHKRLQVELWGAMSSPGIDLIYSAAAPVCHGAFICGAGNGGHVLLVLRAGRRARDVEELLRRNADPLLEEARVVDAAIAA